MATLTQRNNEGTFYTNRILSLLDVHTVSALHESGMVAPEGTFYTNRILSLLDVHMVSALHESYMVAPFSQF